MSEWMPQHESHIPSPQDAQGLHGDIDKKSSQCSTLCLVQWQRRRGCRGRLNPTVREWSGNGGRGKGGPFWGMSSLQGKRPPGWWLVGNYNRSPWGRCEKPCEGLCLLSLHFSSPPPSEVGTGGGIRIPPTANRQTWGLIRPPDSEPFPMASDSFRMVMLIIEDSLRKSNLQKGKYRRVGFVGCELGGGNGHFVFILPPSLSPLPDVWGLAFLGVWSSQKLSALGISTSVLLLSPPLSAGSQLQLIMAEHCPKVRQ